MKIGILSAAHVHTNGLAGAVVDHPDARLAGVVDDDADRGRSMADRHGTEYVPVAEADAFLERIDAAVVCSPNVDHREVDRARGRRGRPRAL